MQAVLIHWASPLGIICPLSNTLLLPAHRLAWNQWCLLTLGLWLFKTSLALCCLEVQHELTSYSKSAKQTGTNLTLPLRKRINNKTKSQLLDILLLCNVQQLRKYKSQHLVFLWGNTLQSTQSYSPPQNHAEAQRVQHKHRYKDSHRLPAAKSYRLGINFFQHQYYML